MSNSMASLSNNNKLTKYVKKFRHLLHQRYPSQKLNKFTEASSTATIDARLESSIRWSDIGASTGRYRSKMRDMSPEDLELYLNMVDAMTHAAEEAGIEDKVAVEGIVRGLRAAGVEAEVRDEEPVEGAAEVEESGTKVKRKSTGPAWWAVRVEPAIEGEDAPEEVAEEVGLRWIRTEEPRACLVDCDTGRARD
jgi:hypothetical protein